MFQNRTTPLQHKALTRNSIRYTTTCSYVSLQVYRIQDLIMLQLLPSYNFLPSTAFPRLLGSLFPSPEHDSLHRVRDQRLFNEYVFRSSLGGILHLYIIVRQ